MEKLGLAVSLVSSVPEKVWYCKQKGYKPWLKPKKKDTGTHEEGGHTIWYNDQQLLKVGFFLRHHKTGLATAFWNGQDEARACVAHVISSTLYPESSRT